MNQAYTLPLEFLDYIPEKIYRRLVTLNYKMSDPAKHRLELRCIGIIQLREKLLAGHTILLDDLSKWLDLPHAQQMLQVLGSSPVSLDSIDNEEYVDDIILHFLNWLDDNQKQILTSPDNKKRHKHPETQPDQNNPDHRQPESDTASHSNEGSISHIENDALLDNLQQSEIMDAMQVIHKSYAIERQLGWDLSRGIADMTSVKQLLKVHNQVKTSSYLQAIIELIGRGKNRKVSLSDKPGVNYHHISAPKYNHILPDDHSVNSVSGIFYSDDVARMLASESALLGHKQLKSLWHARRAEHQLLSYHIRGLLSEHIPQVEDISIIPDADSNKNVKRQGGMIICIDTSASMRGKPELIAKAAVFEIMRVAHLQHRPCYLYAFSGEGEISEYDLNLKKAGWQPLIQFISQSFHGGTDIDGVLQCAFEKLMQSNWHTADLLLVSDGRFKVRDNPAVIRFKAHQPSTVIYGLQVSQWSTTSFGDICHQVFKLNNV